MRGHFTWGRETRPPGCPSLLREINQNISIIVIILDFLIAIGYTYSPAIRQALTFLYAPPLGVIINFAVVVGIGAIAVYLLEKIYNLSINAAILWALVLCLTVCLVVKLLLPLPKALLITFNEIQLMGIAIGVFWKGSPYWR